MAWLTLEGAAAEESAKRLYQRFGVLSDALEKALEGPETVRQIREALKAIAIKKSQASISSIRDKQTVFCMPSKK